MPDVPLLDFATLRASAAATGTLNVYGCRSTQGGAGTAGSATKWDIRASCLSSGAHATHFGNPWSHPKSANPAANPAGFNNSLVWYWDGDLTLSGSSRYNGSTPDGESCGLRGTFIIRGNLTVDTPGEYSYTGHVPANAWQEHNKLLKNTFDTAASAEYPADIGLHKSRSTFGFGTETWCQAGTGNCTWQTTIGLRGFNAMWGGISRSCNSWILMGPYGSAGA